MDGVVRTRVGYSGGQRKDPTYRSIGDHSETIQIDYDPARTSYKKLLFIFWQSHDPTHHAWSRQYMSAIFYQNEEQRKLALETRTFGLLSFGKLHKKFDGTRVGHGIHIHGFLHRYAAKNFFHRYLELLTV